jgi:nucleotide-binding universal stress UspA family protein
MQNRSAQQAPLASDALALRTVLVAHALSESSAIALELGARLARDAGAALHVVHATPCESAHRPQQLAGAEAELKRVTGAAGIASAELHVRAGDPAHVICGVASEIRADLIVLASARAHGAARARLESVSVRTLHHAPCAVLVAPARPAWQLELEAER